MFSHRVFTTDFRIALEEELERKDMTIKELADRAGIPAATQAVRGGTWRSEHGETSEALFLTSGYTYDSAEEVAARFAGEAQGMTYSRLQNPTVEMLEERLALLEGAEAARCSASGMAAVEDHLVRFLAKEKAAVLRKALSSKATDILSNILLQINLTIRSLNMPLEELEQRKHLFEDKIQETERQKMVAGDLLTGDRKRLMEFLEDQAVELRQKGRNHFEHILERTLADTVSIDEARQTLLNELPVFFERELGDMSRAFESRVTEILQPHQERADELIETIRKTAAELFKIPYRAPESSQAFEMTRQPFWATQQKKSFMNPIPEGLVYNLLPAGIRKRRMRKYLTDEIGFLVFQNVENLRWVTLQNLNQAFRRFSLELADRLEDTIVATHGAIHEAMKKRTEQSHAVASDLKRYEATRRNLERIMNSLETE